MKNKLFYTFDNHLKESLKDPEFRKAWEESEPEYLLATKLIEKRLKKKMSQRDLAKKLKTTQAVISRIETMNANPSLSLLKRIAHELDSKLILRFS
jgi:ribosome-binding protein aMBF1 (putative translation factor)